MVECKERSGFSACLHVTFLYVTVCILLQVMNAYYAYQYFVATDFFFGHSSASGGVAPNAPCQDLAS